MKKTTNPIKRTIAFLLVLIMCVSILPTAVFAEEDLTASTDLSGVNHAADDLLARIDVAITNAPKTLPDEEDPEALFESLAEPYNELSSLYEECWDYLLGENIDYRVKAAQDELVYSMRSIEELMGIAIETLANKNCPVTVWGAFVGDSCSGGSAKFTGPTYQSKYVYTIQVPYYSNNSFTIPPVSQFFSNYSGFKYVNVASISNGEKQPGQSILIQSAGVSLVYYFGDSHNWETTTTSATCTSGGSTVKTCTKCGEKQTVSTSGALGHLDKGIYVDNNANGSHFDGCASTTHNVICGRCGVQFKTVSHSYGAWQTILEPTVSSTGLKRRTCACGHYEEDTIAALPNPEKTFTLNYNANGGIGAPETQTATAVADSYDFMVSGVTPTRDGYDFLGWSTYSNATVADIEGGNVIAVNSTVTLFAVWKCNHTKDSDEYCTETGCDHDDDCCPKRIYYTVVLQYWDIKQDGTGTMLDTVSLTNIVGSLGDIIDGAELAAEHTEWNAHEVKGEALSFEYRECDPESITLTANLNKNVITLVYKAKTVDYEVKREYYIYGGYTVDGNYNITDGVKTDGIHYAGNIFDETVTENGVIGKTVRGDELAKANGHWSNLSVDSVERSYDLVAYASNPFVPDAEGGQTLTLYYEVKKYNVTYTDGVDDEVVFDDQTHVVIHANTVNNNENTDRCESAKFVNGNDGTNIPVREGYIFAGWTLNGAPYSFDTPVTSDVTLTAQWEEDALADPANDNNGDKPGDGIPDEYQVTVEYEAINGSVSFTSAVVTKLNEAGEPDVNGEAKLAQEHIPTATPNNGYGDGTWDTEPAVGLTVTNGQKMTITYTPNEPDGVSPSVSPVEGTYNAQNHPLSDVTFTDADGEPVTPDSVSIQYVLSGSDEPIDGEPVNVGTYDAVITAVIDGEPKTWTIEEAVTIDRRRLVITTGSGIKTFDGTPLTSPAFSVDGLAVGDAVAVWTTGSRTAVGAAYNTYGMNWGSTLASNYEVIESLGTLSVISNGTNTIINDVPTNNNPPVNNNPPANNNNPAADDVFTIMDEDVPLAGAFGLNDEDHFAYIIGYDDGTVRPLSSITRAEVATIFFRLMTDEYRDMNWSTENDFGDVQVNDWFNNAISTCENAGILNGYTDGDFRPNASITRAEFAAIAARFIDDADDDGTGDFSDTADHWAAREIRIAAKAGWIEGKGNAFRPDDYITRAEVMTIVNRMLNRVPDVENMLDTMKKWSDNPEGSWYYEAVQEATNGHAYERDEDLGVVESWTEILEVRDWKALEESWADANLR